MEINFNNYDDFILKNFIKLPNEIKCIKGNSTLTTESFKQVFGSADAKSAKNCIYIWKSEKNIPRVKGESNIIYIGQTKKTIFTRHHPSSKLKATSKANKQKYNDIVNLYGSISIYYFTPNKFGTYSDSDLEAIEGQFLWWYFQNHSEYPPVNYTKTKNRNEIVTI